ncbi:protein SDE2 homolog [Limulus polyphemus]|uniref:Protein SDE2 homolog n=1 Tax=Limulus polyphemus TaxID=6850 RepID=A0ABM1BVH6_LIMPO|nr:protein SDE2 homolog [Limulus polyphemus]
MVIFIQSFDSRQSSCIALSNKETRIRIKDLKESVFLSQGIPVNQFQVVVNKHYVKDEEFIEDGSVARLVLLLPGGKGGFGSMLRAIGAQIEKTTNREACRDLSGRRLRDVNEEKRLKKWISKQAEREREAAERKKAKLERLRSMPKHNFHDPEYDQQRSELPEKIDDALVQGLQSAESGPSSKKRKPQDSARASKKTCLWLGVDMSEADIEDQSDTDSEGNGQTQDHVSANQSVRLTSRFEEAKQSQDSGNDDNSQFLNPSCSTSKEQYESSLGSASCVNECLQESDSANKCERPPFLKPYHRRESFTIVDDKPIILMEYQSPQELEALGLDRLKMELMNHGLKCGGTLQQRAQRLWSIRGLEHHEIDSSLLAKPQKNKKIT